MKRHPIGSDATLAKPRERRPEGEALTGFRALVEGSADLITRHAPNGETIYVSPASGDVAGLDPEALMGQGLVRRVHVADLPAYLKSLSDAFNGAAARAVEFRFRHGDELRFVTLEMRCRAILNAEGKAGSIVAVTRDVSDRRLLERDLRGARETAERASIAKTHFLAHMSHELRTPLNAIIGFAEMLQGDAISFLQPERRREYARLIHTSGQHLLDVVNGILDMSKIECGLRDISTEPLAMAPLVEMCCEMVMGQAGERGVTLLRDVPADLPELTADRRAVKQILINLLSNGVKFTNAGGSVRVSVEADAATMRFVIRDTGIGIAAADLPRLGTPFMQADAGYERRYEGTGLGLSMVKGLAALHGGDMKIESVLGSGTTVSVTLPLKPDATAAAPRGGDMKEFKRAG